MAMGASASVIGFNGSLTNASGTSFSAPQITGLVAGVWQKQPDLTALDMVDLIRQAGSGYLSPDNFYGYGIPTYQAVKNILEFSAVGNGILIYPNPVVGNELHVAITPLQGQAMHVELSTLLGQPVYSYQYVADWSLNPLTVNTSLLAPGVYWARVTAGTQTKTFRVIKP